MRRIPLDEALDQLHRTDPTFTPEVRRILAPVKERFFEPPHEAPGRIKDGLLTAPPWMAEPDLREVAIALAELALDHGISVNVVCAQDGSTFLHSCTLLRDQAIAAEAVEWLLVHGADPHQKRDDGETPMGLAVKFGRTEVAALMRRYGGRD
jgi:hypothetical protein